MRHSTHISVGVPPLGILILQQICREREGVTNNLLLDLRTICFTDLVELRERPRERETERQREKERERERERERARASERERERESDLQASRRG